MRKLLTMYFCKWLFLSKLRDEICAWNLFSLYLFYTFFYIAAGNVWRIMTKSVIEKKKKH